MLKATLALLENFFHDCAQNGWGYSDSRISAAEAKLSVSFPKILKQYYARFGACPYIRQEGSNIPVPLDLEEVFIPDSSYNAPYTPNELDFLVFFGFSSVSAIEYGIRLSDLDMEDPPVYYCDWGNPSWVLTNPSLENFLIVSVFWQIGYESRLDCCLRLSQFDYDELPGLSRYAAALGMRDCELENLEKYQYYRIFIKDGVILACDTDEWEAGKETPPEDILWLSASSNDKGKIQAIKKIPDLLWEPDNVSP